MNQMRELKPCPFCGGPVELEKTIDGRAWYGVVCRNTFNRGGTCAVSIRPSASEECAIERWNMRAQSAAVPVVGEVVAWVRLHPDGALSSEFIADDIIEPIRRNSGAWLPMRIQPTKSISADELSRLRERDEQLHYIEHRCKVILPSEQTVWDVDMLKHAIATDEQYAAIAGEKK